MFSMKNILIKYQFQLSRAKVNVKVAVLRNMLLAVRCFHLWPDFDITSYKGLGSIRGYFGLNILGKWNTFV